jgi:hypothetical protein
MSVTNNLYNEYPNPGYDTVYSGNVFAITAQGGYAINQKFDTVVLQQVQPVTQYDVTNSIQVLFDVNVFNQKIGVYNATTSRYQNDTINLTASEFVSGITDLSFVSTSKIISLGAYTSLYSDFISYVNQYFNYANGFTTLFNTQSTFDYNHGLFDAAAFVKIISGMSADPSGGYISNLTGTIQIYNINNIISYACNNNVFGNRDISMVSSTISHGFLDGDVIIIPQGTTATLTLELDISETGVSPGAVGQQSSSVNRFNNSLYNISSSASLNHITQTIKAPLLIRLTDFNL